VTSNSPGIQKFNTCAAEEKQRSQSYGGTQVYQYGYNYAAETFEIIPLDRPYVALYRNACKIWIIPRLFRRVNQATQIVKNEFCQDFVMPTLAPSC
jgi:hypothetical protein